MRPPPGPYASGLRTTLAGLALAGVVAAPLPLLTAVGGPVPGGALTERISTDGVTGTRRVPAEFMAEFAGSLLWFAWAVVMAALLVEVVGAVRARTPPFIEVLRPLQQLHRSLLEQLKQGVRSGGRRTDRPSLDDMLSRVDAPGFFEPPVPEDLVPSSYYQAYEVSGAYTDDGTRAERETFWIIARDQLGDPGRWREVAEANRELLEAHGRSVADPGWPEPGWILRLPGGGRE